MKVLDNEKPYYCSPDQYTGGHYEGELLVNMNHGSKEMIGPAHKMHHNMILGAKVVRETARTERFNEAESGIDVTMNYSRLPKSHNQPQPNDFGEPVYHTLYKKAGKSGMRKGGIKYGK